MTVLPEMNVRELKQKLDNKEEIVVLDVREPGEYQICNIGGLLMPMGDVPMRVVELDPDAPTVVHCHHGVRSAMVVEFLRQQGFTHIQNLAGGIHAWAEQIDPAMPRY